jgi:predicted nuclease of restriction endonuclease-like (RecB) superfamily
VTVPEGLESEMTKITDQKTYVQLLNSVKDRIRKAQYDALKAVNKELIDLYADIGRMIVERQEKEGWGKSVVEKLASDLRKEFPGIQGFSSQNLWRMKQFYQAYAGNEKLSPLVREIGWTHNIIILQCKDNLQREFYIRMTRRMGWTKAKKPIGVAKYRIVSKLPVALRKELPAPKQIAKLMDDLK